MFAESFILLYVAHQAADHIGQTDHQAEHKADSGAAGWRAAGAHAGVHLAVSVAVLTVAGAGALHLPVQPAAAALALLWVAGTHAVIDRRWPVQRWMRAARQTEWAARGGAAHVDQAAHTVCLLVGALILAA